MFLFMEEMKDSYLLFFLTLFFYGQAWSDIWWQRWGVKRNLKFLCRSLVYLLWEVLDLTKRRTDRPEAQINEHRSRYKYLNIHFARNSVGICSQLFIALFVCFLWEKTNLGLSKDYVNIWGRAFEHIWTCNNKENVLGLPNSDACHSVNLFQPKLWHRLVITTTWRKREYVRDFVHNTVSFKVAWNVLVDVQSHLSCFFLTSTLLGSADRLIGRRVW